MADFHSLLAGTYGKIILEKYEKQDQMSGNVIISDAGKEKSNIYRVIHVGLGEYNPYHDKYAPMITTPGDLIVVPKALVYEINVDRETYYMTAEKEMQAFYYPKDND